MANRSKNSSSQQKRRSSVRQRIVKFIHVLVELVRRRLLVRESRLKYLTSKGVSQVTGAAASDSKQMKERLEQILTWCQASRKLGMNKPKVRTPI